MLPEAPLVLLRRDAEEAVSLSGKVALVTGSTSGIGLGIARALAVAQGISAARLRAMSVWRRAE